ncbi:MAG: iduronate-2-sulfatase [Opitutus sp.]|nr:iduronate-2-sulfatase [Opitutus sp.]
MKTQPYLVAAFLLIASTASIAQAAAPRMNVLYIVADDLNDNLGCYGNSVVKSPNVDRLAKHGVRFDRAYCNYPVCNPSRTSFMSGLRPDTTRVVDNKTPTRAFIKDAVLLPECFRQQGYRTIKVGKIFHTGDGDDFEDPRSWDIDIRENNTAKKPPEGQILRKQGKGGIVLRAKDEETWDGFVARKAVTLLEESVQSGKPFFVAAGFRRPHNPYIAPEKYYALYDPESLQPRSGPPAHLAKIPDMALSYKQPHGDKFPTDRPGDTIAAYYASISFMDAQVGVLLEAMDRLRLWENTIIVFHSDHGYHLGEHGGLFHKLNLFEETTKVPLIVAAPGRKPGVASGLVELVDLYPTLAGLCGLKTPDNLEGLSFAPLLENPSRAWKRAVFTVISRDGVSFQPSKGYSPSYMGRTVFDGRRRYTVWPDGSTELYDHASDPYEYANLAGETKHRAEIAGMKKLLSDGWKAAVPAQ